MYFSRESIDEAWPTVVKLETMLCTVVAVGPKAGDVINPYLMRTSEERQERDTTATEKQQARLASKQAQVAAAAAAIQAHRAQTESLGQCWWCPNLRCRNNVFLTPKGRDDHVRSGCQTRPTKGQHIEAALEHHTPEEFHKMLQLGVPKKTEADQCSAIRLCGWCHESVLKVEYCVSHRGWCTCEVHCNFEKGWATHEATPTSSPPHSLESKAYMIMLFDGKARCEAADAFHLMNAHFNGGVGHGYDHRKSISQIKSFFGSEARRRKNPPKPVSAMDAATQYYGAKKTLTEANRQRKHMKEARILWKKHVMTPIHMKQKAANKENRLKEKAEKDAEKAEKAAEQAENKRKRNEDAAFEKEAQAQQKQLDKEAAETRKKQASKKRPRSVVIESESESVNPYQKFFAPRRRGQGERT